MKERTGPRFSCCYISRRVPATAENAGPRNEKFLPVFPIFLPHFFTTHNDQLCTGKTVRLSPRIGGVNYYKQEERVLLYADCIHLDTQSVALVLKTPRLEQGFRLRSAS